MPTEAERVAARLELAERLFALEERHMPCLEAKIWNELSALEREVYLSIIDDLARFSDLWRAMDATIKGQSNAE